MTAETILRAALEATIKGNRHHPMCNTISMPLGCVEWCNVGNARAALDAAAKAEADEETTHSRMSASAKARRKREAAAKVMGLARDGNGIDTVTDEDETKAFKIAMRGFQYGKSETANARHWFVAGWMRGIAAYRKKNT